MPPKSDWEKYKAPVDEDDGPQKEIIPLSEGDIQVLKTYVSNALRLQVLYLTNRRVPLLMELL